MTLANELADSLAAEPAIDNETLLECEARIVAQQTTPPARRCPHCIGRIHPPDCQGGPDFLPKGGRLIPIRPVKAARPALEGPARPLKSPSHTR